MAGPRRHTALLAGLASGIQLRRTVRLRMLFTYAGEAPVDRPQGPPSGDRRRQ